MLKLNLMILMMIAISSIMPNWWSLTMVLIIMTLITISSSLYWNQMIITTLSELDIMSSSMMSLSILISALMLFTSTKILHLNNNKKMFMNMTMMLLLTLVNAFSSTNIFMFYIWFEASLIPTMMIILMWGYQPERMQASMYMMIYTITASLPMLMMFIMVYNSPNSTLIIMNMFEIQFPEVMKILIILGFLVKLPMFLFHLWLPKAHVEAPIAGSMILAAILLKLGGYGVARLMLLTHTNISSWSNLLIMISMVGGVITSMICMRQTDLKSLIAYSSVGHMGLMLAGTLSYSLWGMHGTLLMMIAHGLCSSTLFSLANINYEMTHTRSMYMSKGMMVIAPVLTMWWFIFSAINMAAPPSINLLSEIMLITSIMSYSSFYMITLMLITFMTGAYSLLMYSNTQHGSIHNFSNSLPSINHNKLMMISSHVVPLITMIIMSDYITAWTW